MKTKAGMASTCISTSFFVSRLEVSVGERNRERERENYGILVHVAVHVPVSLYIFS